MSNIAKMIKTVLAPLATDSYKLSHIGFELNGVERIYSNGTARCAKYFKQKYPNFNGEVVVFGMQYVVTALKEFWNKNFFDLSWKIVEVALKEILNEYVGEYDISHFKKLHKLGYLPVEICSIQEGTIVPLGIPHFTIENTIEGFEWLPNYLETLISVLYWKPMTVANVAQQFYLNSKKYSKLTCDNDDHIMFQNHDFSMRGQSGLESSGVSCMGWMLFSNGSDNIPSVVSLRRYYECDEFVAASVPASEHSVTTLGINMMNPLDTADGELKYLDKVITDLYPTGIVSYVADSYDYWNTVTNILPKLKDKIMQRDGKLVVRGDSGDPVDIICGIECSNVFDNSTYANISIEELKENIAEYVRDEGYVRDDEITYTGYFKVGDKYYNAYCEALLGCERGAYTDDRYYFIEDVMVVLKEVDDIASMKGTIECLWDIFGGTVNEKGFKVLDSHIGMIYGDGITFERQDQIFKRLKAKGFASSNIVLGIGSYSMNMLSRDDLGFAIKATNAQVNGNNIPIYKNPKTDATKKSAKGLLKVITSDGVIVLVDEVSREEMDAPDNLLVPIFVNGATYFTHDNKLSDIRKRLK